MKSRGLSSSLTKQSSRAHPANEVANSQPDVIGICLIRGLRLFARLPVVIAWAAMFCLFGLTALATPGDLDTTLAGTGIVRVGFGLGADRANGAALQSDGKIIVVG